MSQTTIQWHLEEGMDDDRFTDVKRGTDTMCVCSGYDRVERYQRAAFIVQACNSHDALVEALENLLITHYRTLSADPGFRPLWIEAKAALDKAKDHP